MKAICELKMEWLSPIDNLDCVELDVPQDQPRPWFWNLLGHPWDLVPILRILLEIQAIFRRSRLSLKLDLSRASYLVGRWETSISISKGEIGVRP